ncbi:S1 RNA-binding domain-containing protein [Synechococcales cyanobacterium C]|uniref:S1 RNA-binding domain-containing protein n=1 Tax=Petrachloros mirabilis ULC683 TaxID=2781853 RepID=A0A8K2A888_9CYAN|nr:S1 RNA-binding domain-containing protein [Petrachloros mirabilis]NCJ06865.1 S1 RNA-binding domain-containing protein [Petrachloros mirabilis ULC683]
MTFSADEFARALAQHDYVFEVGETVRGTVIQHDNEGAYVDIGGKAAAFIPKTELSIQATRNLAESLPLQETHDFLIIRGQDAEGQVLLSIRRLEIQALWARLEQQAADNQTLQVWVTGVNKGGVTVDVEGLRGFIPRSHLAERGALEALVGSQLMVSFLEVDPNRNKLVLSNRLAMRSSRMEELEIGQLVRGTVTDLKPYGAFIDLNGITALLHIKEVSQNYIASLPEVLKVGQSIQAVVLDLDPGRSRISLSTKALENQAGEILDNWEQVMAEAEVRAHRFQDKLKQA